MQENEIDDCDSIYIAFIMSREPSPVFPDNIYTYIYIYIYIYTYTHSYVHALIKQFDPMQL